MIGFFRLSLLAEKMGNLTDQATEYYLYCLTFPLCYTVDGLSNVWSPNKIPGTTQSNRARCDTFGVDFVMVESGSLYVHIIWKQRTWVGADSRLWVTNVASAIWACMGVVHSLNRYLSEGSPKRGGERGYCGSIGSEDPDVFALAGHHELSPPSSAYATHSLPHTY